MCLECDLVAQEAIEHLTYYGLGHYLPLKKINLDLDRSVEVTLRRSFTE